MVGAAGAAEFPKVKELPKLGARADLAPSCCPSAAPNAGGELAPGYSGAGVLVAELKGMLKAGVAALLRVSVGWLLLAAGAEVVGVAPKLTKPVLLLAVGALLGVDWPKVVAAVEAGVADALTNWNMEPRTGVKLAPEAGGAPKRKGWEVDVAVLVPLLTALVEGVTPKLNMGLGVVSAAALVELAGAGEEVLAAVALAGAVKTGALVTVTGVAVWVKEKERDKGTDVGGPGLSNIGLKVGAL